MPPSSKRRQAFTRLRLWARRVGLERKFARAVVAASVIAGLITVATMTGSAQTEGPDPKIIIVLLYVDLVLLLLLGVIVARRMVTVWAERRRGMAGSRMHIRFVVLFSVVAATPAVLVAIFSALFLNFGVQSWFSERVRTALEESHAVASAYLHEHRQTIRADAFAMANDLNREAATLMRNPELFSKVLSSFAAIRGVSEAVVSDSSGRVIARSDLSFSLEFDLVPPSALEKAAEGVVVLTNEQDNRVRAVVKLNRFVDAYLLVGRFVEAEVIEHIERTTAAVAQYKSLEKQRKSFQISFVMIFVLVALLLLLAAIWTGLTVATQLARPISNLIGAAEKVTNGDLSVRVEASPASDEIGTLSRAFNRMTGQLETQRQGLIDANRELDERRRFTETVLAGVSAGVIGLDDSCKIHLPNRSACELLDIDLDRNSGKPLADVVPEMAPLVHEAIRRPDRPHQSEIKIMRAGQPRTLSVNAAAERIGEDVIGYVVTFDDITELLSAQRQAAWADVARRIAHEIKNPLTPIQLSAERLKRKYLKEVNSDPETFAACTETIVRQVKDIGRMVDEFSSFARMPQATIRRENLSDICRQALFLERNRQSGITFGSDLPDTDIYLRCDNRQIGQALTNLLKNAAESVMGREGEEAEEPGFVQLSLREDATARGSTVFLAVEDNGRGLPAEERDRLTEPYVTTRTKGTGLGLAIVKKIMEDHSGDLVLEDREGGGARVSLIFRPRPEDGKESDVPEPDPAVLAAELVGTGSKAGS